MSKKIMFSDKYSLTQAVLDGRKTQTRRIVKDVNLIQYLNELEEDGDLKGIRGDIVAQENARYEIDEIVAIAQAYKDIGSICFEYWQMDEDWFKKGFNNKMFVKAQLMPHHIRITDVRIERLQDISDEDCIAEGIYKRDDILDANLEEVVAYTFSNSTRNWLTPREAYATLIDKISGKGTWDANTFVFVYEFELID